MKLEKLTVWVACAGSQYCCWNNDSSLVAVSSDYYRAVMVFDVHEKQQVCLQMMSTSISMYVHVHIVKLCFWSLALGVSAEQRVCHLSESFTWWTLAWCYPCHLWSIPTCCACGNELRSHEHCHQRVKKGYVLRLSMPICSFNRWCNLQLWLSQPRGVVKTTPEQQLCVPFPFPLAHCSLLIHLPDLIGFIR